MTQWSSTYRVETLTAEQDFGILPLKSAFPDTSSLTTTSMVLLMANVGEEVTRKEKSTKNKKQEGKYTTLNVLS